MRLPELFQPLTDTVRGEQFKPTVILLSAPILLTLWKYAGSPEFYEKHFGEHFLLWDDLGTTAAVYHFGMCFFLMGVVPALLVKCVFREQLAEYGVRIGDWRRTLGALLAWTPVMVLAGYLASRDPSVVAQYPINPGACRMFGFHAATYVMFYLGWEFYFRGFMQAGLRPSLGMANAMWVQVAVSVLLHIGKPGVEIYSSIPAAVLWGLLAYRTRSILSGTLQHITVGVTLDWFICQG